MATVAWCRGDRIVGWPDGDVLIEVGPSGVREHRLPFVPSFLHVTEGAGLVVLDRHGAIWHGRVGDARLRKRAALERFYADEASFSGDGGRIALSEDDSADLYDGNTGTRVQAMFQAEADSVACALSANGRRIAVNYRTKPYFSGYGSAGDWGRGTLLLEVPSGETIGHEWLLSNIDEPGRPHVIAISPEGRRVALSDRTHFVHVLDERCEYVAEADGAFEVLACGERVVVGSGPEGFVVLGATCDGTSPGALALALSPDERSVAALQADRITVLALLP